MKICKYEMRMAQLEVNLRRGTKREADPPREPESKKRREGNQQPRMITEDDSEGDICKGWKARGVCKSRDTCPWRHPR
jgi:hypothetical protein